MMRSRFKGSKTLSVLAFPTVVALGYALLRTGYRIQEKRESDEHERLLAEADAIEQDLRGDA